ncbi:complement factor H-related protein 1-like isoform X5 [Erythrolamprus reginae]|uniref:complement factor H-related protein 1-like isoform X5 n=1 Tax=Erythrolamprus reginae TaxID=121349 RepID=UPI00396C783B
MKGWLVLVAAFLLWPGCSSQNACDEPDEIDFGEIVSAEKAKYLENDRVQYRCNPVYVLEGPEWIQCKGQEWTPHPPKCLAPCSVTRQQLATKNLLVFGNQRKARLIQSNQSLQFQCNKGYVLVAPSVRKCVDGYIDLPLCISEVGKNCSGPPRTENGDITTLSEKQYRSGSSVEFRCQNYYAIEGQNRSFCDNGTWTKVPICLDPCMITRTELESQKIEVIKDEIDAPENIFVQHGRFIELTCKTGYVLAANSSQSAFVIHCDGTPPVIPKCKEITCNSPRLSHGTFRPQRTIYHNEDLIRIRCDTGFTFEPDNGEKVVECTKNGWSPPPKCFSATCHTPPIVENARISEDTIKKYTNGEKITYQCNDGFEISGSATVTCRQNNWSRLPRCQDVRCSSPPEIQNGQIVGDIKEKYFPQEKVYYQCSTRYTFLGSSFITCLKKRWEQQLPRCTAACTTDEGDMSERNITLKYNRREGKIYSEDGDRVQFICRRGYKPNPNKAFTVYCVDGKFDYPNCTPI